MRPASTPGMHIGLAHAARFGLHEVLIRSAGRNVQLPKCQGLSEFRDDGGLHLVFHR